MNSITETLGKSPLASDSAVLENSLNLRPRLVDIEYSQKLPLTKLTALLNALENNLPSHKGLVFFAGTDGCRDTAQIAFETALTAAFQHETPVLFLNMTEALGGSILQKLETETAISLDEFLAGGGGTVSPFISLRRGGLFFTNLKDFGQHMPMQTLRALLLKLREQFGLIITYSGSALSDGSVAALASLVDGTVLVAEAERTRSPVAKQLKKTIEEQNGKVIGAVLSRQRFYIPRWLYALLYGSRSA